MSTHCSGPQSGGHTLRLLVLDGTPGATTLLVLAAHGALPRPEAALIPDTGWYPTSAYEHLDRLARLATDAGIEAVWVDAGSGTAAAAYDPSRPCPLPLHTRTPGGTAGRLANGCARQQAEAVDAAIHGLLGIPRATRPPRTAAECVLGLTAEYAHLARPARSPHRRNRYPLIELGWRTPVCRAHLAMHDLDFMPDVACIACPERSSPAWAELRAADPQAWQEAVAVDAALRHRPATAAPGGMPPGTTGYLHPARVPLAEADLAAAPDAAASVGGEGCVQRACRGTQSGTDSGRGGAA